MKDDIDFLDDISAVDVGGDIMKQLSSLAETHGEYSTFIKKLEARLKEGKKLITQIEEEFVPSLMQEAGMKEFKTTNGFSIKIQSFVRGSIPTQNTIDKKKGEEAIEMQERRDNALAWLNNNDGASIIKHEFAFKLGKGTPEDVTQSLVDVAVKLGLPYDDAENVHAGTLNAFIKEKIENGKDIPSEVFNLHVGDKAKIVKK